MGFLSTRAIADAVLRSLSDRSAACLRASAAGQRVKKFSIPRMARQQVEVYEQIRRGAR
jgi:glycosyltransferase involved in cell wall biosynthesis